MANLRIQLCFYWNVLGTFLFQELKSKNLSRGKCFFEGIVICITELNVGPGSEFKFVSTGTAGRTKFLKRFLVTVKSPCSGQGPYMYSIFYIWM